MVESMNPGETFQCMEMPKGKIDLQGFHNLHRTMFCGQFMICMYAILPYGQFTIFMKPYITHI